MAAVSNARLHRPGGSAGRRDSAGEHAVHPREQVRRPPPSQEFGLWVEQLIAERTGKHDKGVVPTAGEPLGDRSVYGSDRLFTRVQAASAGDLTGEPSVDISMPEPTALGAEFVRW